MSWDYALSFDINVNGSSKVKLAKIIKIGRSTFHHFQTYGVVKECGQIKTDVNMFLVRYNFNAHMGAARIVGCRVMPLIKAIQSG